MSPSEAARLTAIRNYLTHLSILQLVTPSIGLPYPRIVTEEKLSVHKVLLEIQKRRIMKNG